MAARPAGIVLFSILYVLVGLFSAVTIPLFSLLLIITSIGVFLHKPFGRYLAITVSALGTLINTINLIQFIQTGIEIDITVALILTYVFHLFAIYYFTRPDIIDEFS